MISHQRFNELLKIESQYRVFYNSIHREALRTFSNVAELKASIRH